MARRVVDLTQTLSPSTGLWPGSNPVERVVTCERATHGFFSQDWRTPEHAGTHLDAPVHFHEGGAFVDGIPADRLVVPAAVIDVAAAATDDPDYTLGADDVAAAEERDGMLEPGSAVLVRTGWDRPGYLHDEPLRFPGVGVGAAELLIGRGVVGIGIDTAGIDPGHASDTPVHHMTLPAGLWHLEGLVNLDQLPARGALLFVGALKLERGSGAPARVLALV